MTYEVQHVRGLGECFIGAALTPMQVEGRLLWLNAELDTCQKDIHRCERDLLAATRTYERARVRAKVAGQIEGRTVAEREEALQAALDEELHARRLAEAQVRTERERMRVLLEQVRIAQSLRASISASMSLT